MRRSGPGNPFIVVRMAGKLASRRAGVETRCSATGRLVLRRLDMSSLGRYSVMLSWPSGLNFPPSTRPMRLNAKLAFSKHEHLDHRADGCSRDGSYLYTLTKVKAVNGDASKPGGTLPIYSSLPSRLTPKVIKPSRTRWLCRLRASRLVDPSSAFDGRPAKSGSLRRDLHAHSPRTVDWRLTCRELSERRFPPFIAACAAHGRTALADRSARAYGCLKQRPAGVAGRW